MDFSILVRNVIRMLETPTIIGVARIVVNGAGWSWPVEWDVWKLMGV
tara:strand:- start:331 stop:471 length:141 start_codon:yes stop_codon:yes gene_type:complete